MYSVPLRRALVTGTDLPYPGRRGCGRSAEGRRRAWAARRRIARGLDADRAGVPSSPPLYALLAADAASSRDAAKSVPRRGSGATGSLDQPVDGADRRRPPRRPGRRHRDVRRPADQLGLSRPALHARSPAMPARHATSTTFVSDVFRHKVRFIGAGTIGVAAIWTLLRIIGPIVERHPRRARRQRASARPGAAKSCR